MLPCAPVARQASEQYRTSSQLRAHFFRQVMGRPHDAHGFVGRNCLFPLNDSWRWFMTQSTGLKTVQSGRIRPLSPSDALIFEIALADKVHSYTARFGEDRPDARSTCSRP